MLSKSLTIAAAGNSSPPAPDPVWNLSTASFNGTPNNYYNMYSNNFGEKGLFWVSSGLVAYSCAGLLIYQWDASSAFDVSTITASGSKSLSGINASPFNPYMRADGLKLYVTNASTDEIQEFDLSTAFNITTASLLRSFSVAAQNASPAGLWFKPDGTKMYSNYTGTTSALQTVYEYDLSTAWDISTASYSGNSRNHGLRNAKTFLIDPSGIYMFISIDIGTSTPCYIYRYTMSTAWNVSTAVYSQTFDLRNYGGNRNPQVSFNQTGTKFFLTTSESSLMWSFDLSTGWDLTTASFTIPSDSAREVISGSSSGGGLGLEGMYIDPDGNHLYRTQQLGVDQINQFAFGTPFDLSTLSYVRSFSVASQETVPLGVTFKPDGTKMYVIGSVGDDVNEYTLGTAWDISSASFVQSFSVAAQDGIPTSVQFKPDGTKMYVWGGSGKDVNEYTLSSAWDVSTASFVGSSSSFSAYVSTSYGGLYFRSDGYYAYLSTSAGSSGSPANSCKVIEFELSTAWDVSTMSFVQQINPTTRTNPLNVKSDQLFTAISFNPDGSQLFLADRTNKFMISLDMTPPTP